VAAPEERVPSFFREYTYKRQQSGILGGESPNSVTMEQCEALAIDAGGDVHWVPLPPGRRGVLLLSVTARRTL
jgi:hypothetical protein